MEMASTTTSTAGTDTTSKSGAPSLGGIEDLQLKVGPVRRNLFGPVDHDQLRQDFQRLLCMSAEVANKRWNYDFQSDVPGTDSNIEWEELRFQDVPSFYRSCLLRPAAAAAARPRAGARWAGPSSPSEGASASGNSSSSGSGDEYLEVTTRGCYRVKLSAKRRQAAITDFFWVKKRKLLHYKGSSRQ